MKIEVDCSDESEVRQALDFLNTIVAEFQDSPGMLTSEETSEEFQGSPGMLTSEETSAEFPVSDAFPHLYDEAELDSAGVVWNAEKHSSGKTKTTNGCWRARARRKKGEVGISGTEGEPGYAELLSLVSKCIAEEKITAEDLGDVCAVVGVEKLPDLVDHPQRIKEAFVMINTRYAIQAVGGDLEAVTE